MKRFFDRQKCLDAAAALLVAVVFCLPMFSGMIRSGADTAFHLNRIYRLAEGLAHGDLYPRIFPEMHMHFGYGSPLFYSVCMLYPAALLVCLGMSVLNAYRILVFLAVFTSALMMILFLRPLCHDRRTPVLSAALCLLNPFVLANCYKRGALGEILALVFLPVIMTGIRDVFFRRKRNVTALAAGFAGLLLSHNITFILALFILVLFCIPNLRRKNLKNILICVSAGLFLAFLLTAFFSLPMLEQLRTHLYRISGYFGEESFSASGVRFTELFRFGLGDDVMMNMCPGLCALFAFGALLDGNRFQKQCFWIGTLLLVMSTNLFPWRTGTMMSFMQFPARFLTPAVVLLTAAASAWLDLLLLKGRKQLKYGFFAVMFLLGSVHVIQLYSNWGAFNDELADEDLFNEMRIFGERAWYNRMELSSPDYLPADAEINYYTYSTDTVRAPGGNAALERSYGRIVFTAEEAGVYTVPRTFYTGYRAVSLDENGKRTGRLPVRINQTTGLVDVEVSEPCIVRVYYGMTLIQGLGDLLTLLGICLSVLLVCMKYDLLPKTVQQKDQSEETKNAEARV